MCFIYVQVSYVIMFFFCGRSCLIQINEMKLDDNGTDGLGTLSMLTPMTILRRRAVHVSFNC